MTTSHSDGLGVLARAEPAALKAYAEGLLPKLGEIEVLSNRTGLAMLPMRDTAQGTAFHLGEVLMSEAHIRIGAHEGYGMRRGRDLEAAMAMAVIDLALDAGQAPEDCAAFIAEQVRAQRVEDDAILCRVEATRINMETF